MSSYSLTTTISSGYLVAEAVLACGSTVPAERPSTARIARCPEHVRRRRPWFKHPAHRIGKLVHCGRDLRLHRPNLLSYASDDGRTITITPDFLTRSLDAGTNVTLQANDDITIDSPIDETSTGTPGSLTLEAGRSILINAGINTDGANLSLIANDSVADGVVDSERDPGNADITVASGATLNTGSGSLNIDLEESTDKTNNDRGSVTLQGVDSSTLTLPAGSPLAVSINGTTPGDGVAAGTYSQLDVSGSIDLNEAPLQVTANTALAAGTTLPIVQSGSGVTGTFRGLPEGSLIDTASGSVFSISYQADGGNAVVLTALATVLTIPSVTGLLPAQGPNAGGTQVSITGTNLAGASAVDFGSVQVTSFASDTSDEITLLSPAGSGTVDVTVVTPNGTSVTSPADQFNYVAAPAAPSVTAIAPATGLTTGGTTVTITGTNLANASAVDFGSVQVTSFLSDTANEITLASPAGSGTVDVTVVTPNGTSAASPADQFSYVAALPPPDVTGIAPATGPSTGGTTVTITGTNLANASAVDFGSVQLTSFLSDTANEITLLSPAATGPVDVTVVTAGGHSPVLADDKFTYVSTVASPTSLSAVSGNGSSGGNATLTSALTESGSPLPGRIVTFSLSEGGTVRNVGTAMTDEAGVATLSGVSLAGLAAGTYSGAVLASFAGDSTDAASSAIGTLVVNSKPLLTIIGEQSLFLRKTNKKGKPIGRATLSGFVFDFSEPLNPISAANSGNYQVDADRHETGQEAHATRLSADQELCGVIQRIGGLDHPEIRREAGIPQWRSDHRGRGINVRSHEHLGRHAFRKSGLYDLTAWSWHRRSVNPSRPPRVIGPRLAAAEKSKRKPCRLDSMGSLSDMQQKLPQNLWKPCESLRSL